MKDLHKVLQNIIFDYVDGDIVNPIIKNNLRHVDWCELSNNKNTIYIFKKILEA